MQTAEQQLEEIDRLLKDFGHCECTLREHCEACDSTSYFNRLREAISEVIHGPKSLHTLEQYGKVFVIKL